MPVTPPSLSHFIIFNPTLKPVLLPGTEDAERDKDLEDDLREAAQILFYTSRESGGVSRDKMLRQTGLVKGIMGFTDMIAKGVGDDDFWSVKSHKSRLVVYSPEPDFFVYVNITLGLTTPDPAKEQTFEPMPIQGLSDRRIVDALRRGYADFRLQYGSFGDLVPPSTATSSLLDKYWTRYAFAFENDHLLSTPSEQLEAWLGIFPSAPAQLSEAVARAVEVFVDDCDLDPAVSVGVIGKDGLLHDTAGDIALSRFLFSLVQASLPVPVSGLKLDARQSLGLGARKVEPRKSSWATFGSAAVGWVPSLGSTPRSVTPVQAKDEGKAKWAFGMPSLGFTEGLGSVGTVFGLGKAPTSSPSLVQTGPMGPAARGAPARGTKYEQEPDARADEDVESSRPTSLNKVPAADIEGVSSNPATIIPASEEDELASLHQVEQTVVDMPDLQAAFQPEDEIDLGWERRSVYVDVAGEHTKRRLTWIIRDSVLLYLLVPSGDDRPPAVPSRAVLALFSRLDPILANGERAERASTDSSRPHPSVIASNTAYLARVDDETSGCTAIKTGSDHLDQISAEGLGDLRDLLKDRTDVTEVYARTPANKFITAKRVRLHSGQSDASSDSVRKTHELYMAVGKKDANLSEAEQSVRGYFRDHSVVA